MKKIIISFIFILSFVLEIFAYSKKNNLFSEVGFIKSYGNAPFTYPVFVTENNEKYNINADSETKSTLLSLQGQKIILTGEIEDGEIFKAIKVSKYKVVE